MAPLRRHVAGSRVRYVWNGFDLDLSYVTSRVIAMGFPSSGAQAFYRNPRQEVARFLKWAHHDNFRIYNLCVEEGYSCNGFPENTARFPCIDHCPPQFSVLLDFCRDCEQWLRRRAENVVAIHCKAGKGRSGCMICALLVFSGAVDSAYDALRFYEWARGGRRSGVTIPAQIRWVAMLERWLRKGEEELSSNPANNSPVAYRLRSVFLGPFHDRQASDSWRSTDISAHRMWSMRIGLLSREAVRSGRGAFWYKAVIVEPDAESTVEVVLPDGPGWVDRDGLVAVLLTNVGGCALYACSKPAMKLRAWWHHAFLRRQPGSSWTALVLDVNKAWIDGMQKDMRCHQVVPEDFRLKVIFEELDKEEDWTSRIVDRL